MITVTVHSIKSLCGNMGIALIMSAPTSPLRDARKSLHPPPVINNLKGGDPMSSEFNLSEAFAMRIAGSAGAASL